MADHYPDRNIKIIWTIKELVVDLSKYFPTPPLTYRPIIPTDSSSRHLQAFSKVDNMPIIVGSQFISSAASSGTLSPTNSNDPSPIKVSTTGSIIATSIPRLWLHLQFLEQKPPRHNFSISWELCLIKSSALFSTAFTLESQPCTRSIRCIWCCPSATVTLLITSFLVSAYFSNAVRKASRLSSTLDSDVTFPTMKSRQEQKMESSDTESEIMFPIGCIRFQHLQDKELCFRAWWDVMIFDTTMQYLIKHACMSTNYSAIEQWLELWIGEMMCIKLIYLLQMIVTIERDRKDDSKCDSIILFSAIWNLLLID